MSTVSCKIHLVRWGRSNRNNGFHNSSFRAGLMPLFPRYHVIRTQLSGGIIVSHFALPPFFIPIELKRGQLCWVNLLSSYTVILEMGQQRQYWLYWRDSPAGSLAGNTTDILLTWWRGKKYRVPSSDVLTFIATEPNLRVVVVLLVVVVVMVVAVVLEEALERGERIYK